MRLRVGRGREGADYATSSTDMSYLLIIFLVLCAAFAAGMGLRLRLPDRASEPRKLTPEQVVSITLSGDGTAAVEGVRTLDRGAAIRQAVSAKPEAVVVVEVAAELAYRVVLDVLAEAKDAGADRFSLTTAPPNPVPVKVEGADAD